MRTYPRNSAQAVARVVALAALADGHVSRTELSALEALEGFARLGLTRADVQQVLQHLSEDLQATAITQWGTACLLDPDTLCALMAEVTDPALQRVALDLCVAVTHADGHVADAEQSVISAAARDWRMSEPVAV